MLMLLFLVAVGAFSGCGDDNDDEGMPKTLEGAKDRIRTLAAEITRLNTNIKNTEDKAKAEQAEFRLLVSQLRQENDDLARTARLGERMEPLLRENNIAALTISIVVNLLAFLVIVFMQLRHRRFLDERNAYVTNRLHE
jgi:multidrug resistance efflux pump